MKLSINTKIVLILFISLNSLQINAQSRPDTMPVYPGCEQAEQKMTCLKDKLLHHIADNFDIDLLNNVKDADNVNMLIVFTIDVDGKLTDFNINSGYPVLDKEMLRVLHLVPSIIPAKRNGEAVLMQYSLPVSFEVKHKSFFVIFSVLLINPSIPPFIL